MGPIEQMGEILKTALFRFSNEGRSDGQVRGYIA